MARSIGIVLFRESGDQGIDMADLNRFVARRGIGMIVGRPIRKGHGERPRIARGVGSRQVEMPSQGRRDATSDQVHPDPLLFKEFKTVPGLAMDGVMKTAILASEQGIKAKFDNGSGVDTAG